MLLKFQPLSGERGSQRIPQRSVINFQVDCHFRKYSLKDCLLQGGSVWLSLETQALVVPCFEKLKCVSNAIASTQ